MHIPIQPRQWGSAIHDSGSRDINPYNDVRVGIGEKQNMEEIWGKGDWGAKPTCTHTHGWTVDAMRTDHVRKIYDTKYRKVE